MLGGLPIDVRGLSIDVGERPVDVRGTYQYCGETAH